MVLPREGLIGSITILDKDGYGSVTASGARIINLANPVGLQDAATKDYVDSLSIGNHAGSHQSGGSDQIDGYQLAIAYTPINYTAPSSNILGQHLRRIDNKLGTLGVGTGDFKSDGTVSMTGNINVGNNNIINVNLVDGYSIPDLAIAITSISNSLNNHSSRHENGGADEIDVTGLSGLLADPQVGIAHASSHQSGGVDQIDGYQIEVSYTPVNYEVPSSNVLGQHLKRIDDALGVLSGSGEPVQVSIEVTSDGQTSFTLPQIPHADGYVQMFVNGLKQQYGVDYYGIGTAIIYTGTLPLKDTDAVEFWYTGVSAVWEPSASGSLYTVSPVPGLARFTTIQAAIDQATTDGATFASPAVIEIYPGTYSGGLTLTAPSSGGGIVLKGMAPNPVTLTGGGMTPVIIDVAVTVTNDGTENLWGFERIKFEGGVTFVGTSTSSYLVTSSECYFTARVTVQEAGCVWNDSFSLFRTLAADPLLFSQPSGYCRFVGTRIIAQIAFRAIEVMGEFMYCYVAGHVENYGAVNRYYYSLLGASSTCLFERSTNVCELFQCRLYQTGASAVYKTGVGELREIGNFVSALATAPNINVAAGTVASGALMT